MALSATLRERALNALEQDRRRQEDEARAARLQVETCAREFFCDGMRQLFGITLDTPDVTLEWLDAMSVRVGATVDGIEFIQEYGTVWLESPPGPDNLTFWAWDSTTKESVATFVRSLVDLGEYLEATRHDH